MATDQTGQADQMDFGSWLRGAADNLFYGGLGSVLLGPAGFLGGLILPELMKPGGVLGPAVEEPTAEPVAPTLNPSDISGGFGIDNTDLGQSFFASLPPELWAPMQMSLSQRTAMNRQNQTNFNNWQNMMQSAFTHAANALNQIPTAYERGSA